MACDMFNEVKEEWEGGAYHSRSLYIIVKNTWRNRLTAFMSTANRYSHASPDIIVMALDAYYSRGIGG